jgi:signal transduction histidine kinase
MKRLWPHTLSGQLILVMLLAVALSQAVTLLIYRVERAKCVHRVVGDECLSRFISAYRLAETAATAENRAHMLEAIGSPLTRFWITPSLIDSSDQWQQMARERLLKPLAKGESQPSAVDLMLGLASDRPWQVIEASNTFPQRSIHVLDLPKWNGFGYAMQLSQGGWLNMVYAKPAATAFIAPTPGYYTALVATILISALVAILVAKRISRPLQHLTESTESLGRGEELKLIPEEGPADIRSTVGAFNRMQIRLRRYLDDRTQMLAAISHDLRTPITSMRLRTEFIEDADTREKITTTLDEMQRMVEAGLSFAQAESRVEATRAVELNALVESICDDLADLQWKVEFEGGERLPYACRPSALRRALCNVIENAVRYGDSAKVKLLRTNESVEIVVTDQGPGIPPDGRDRVFNPFVRLETSRSRETGGVGLGLSIARSVIRSHGGEISFSQQETGFQVHLSLPSLELDQAIVR